MMVHEETSALPVKKWPSIETLNSDIPAMDIRGLHKDRSRRLLWAIVNRLRLRPSATVTISKPDPTYRVSYLGNVVTGWAKGEGCVEKPVATLWCNYRQSSRPDVRMQLSISRGGGLNVTTKEHGLTEYWAHRLTCCAAPESFPRLFCWVYRHEGRRLRHELRCHAVLCTSSQMAQQIDAELKQSLASALAEFKRDKLCRQKARLSLHNSVNEHPTMPRRKLLLSTQNYRPPLERSKSAPKLTCIQEEEVEEEDEGRAEKDRAEMRRICKAILRHYDSTNTLLERRRCRHYRRLQPLLMLHTSKFDDSSSMEGDSPTSVDLEAESDGSSLSSGCSSGDSDKLEAKMSSTSLTITTGDISLVPVGETSPISLDLNELNVWKDQDGCLNEISIAGEEGEEVGENESACSDESGFDEEELASSIGHVVLV